MTVQSTFIWANYLLPNSPYCMIYLWWETERENWSWSLLGMKKLSSKSIQYNRMWFIHVLFVLLVGFALCFLIFSKPTNWRDAKLTDEYTVWISHSSIFDFNVTLVSFCSVSLLIEDEEKKGIASNRIVIGELSFSLAYILWENLYYLIKPLLYIFANMQKYTSEQ